MSVRRPLLVIVTAEHGGNEVPAPLAPLFEGYDEVLASHRGWDPGTLHLSRRLADALNAERFWSTVTRLLVDLNRSPHNPRVFSEMTADLPLTERRQLLDTWHRPHRERVRDAVVEGARRGQVLHLGVHSFTPVWEGEERRVDLSLLYDPARRSELHLATAWTRAMAAGSVELRIRRNNPYRGANDGLTTWLRKEFPDDRYLGIEIEVNQRHLLASGRFPDWVERTLLDGLATATAGALRDHVAG